MMDELVGACGSNIHTRIRTWTGGERVQAFGEFGRGSEASANIL